MGNLSTRTYIFPSSGRITRCTVSVVGASAQFLIESNDAIKHVPKPRCKLVEEAVHLHCHRWRKQKKNLFPMHFYHDCTNKYHYSLMLTVIEQLVDLIMYDNVWFKQLNETLDQFKYTWLLTRHKCIGFSEIDSQRWVQCQQRQS